MNRVVLDPSAEAEIRHAATWYRERSPEVARRFLKELRAIREVLARSPHRFPALSEPEADPPVRRALLRGFPYAVIFVALSGSVHVLAVVHLRRDPGFWANRLRRDV